MSPRAAIAAAVRMAAEKLGVASKIDGKKGKGLLKRVYYKTLSLECKMILAGSVQDQNLYRRRGGALCL